MIAQVVAPDGEAMVQVEAEVEAEPCTDPITLGLQVAEDLKSKGALDLLSATVA
jgi:hypothetical protein